MEKLTCPECGYNIKYMNGDEEKDIDTTSIRIWYVCENCGAEFTVEYAIFDIKVTKPKPEFDPSDMFYEEEKERRVIAHNKKIGAIKDDEFFM